MRLVAIESTVWVVTDSCVVCSHAQEVAVAEGVVESGDQANKTAESKVASEDWCCFDCAE